MSKFWTIILISLLPFLTAGKVAMYGGGRGAVDTLRDTDRRWGLCQTNSTAATDLGPVFQGFGFGVGGAAADACAFGNGAGAGTADATPALTGATRMFVTYTSGATSGNYGYWKSNSGNTDTRALYKPLAVFVIHSGATSTAAVWWFGMEESLALGNLTPSNAQATTIDHAAVAFNAATSSAWRCCSGDGTNASCADITGSTWTANAEFKLTVDMRTAGQTRCCVKNIGASAEWCVTKTTNQPGAAVDLGMMAGVKTTEAIGKKVSVNRMYLEQN